MRASLNRRCVIYWLHLADSPSSRPLDHFRLWPLFILAREHSRNAHSTCYTILSGVSQRCTSNANANEILPSDPSTPEVLTCTYDGIVRLWILRSLKTPSRALKHGTVPQKFEGWAKSLWGEGPKMSWIMRKGNILDHKSYLHNLATTYSHQCIGRNKRPWRCVTSHT